VKDVALFALSLGAVFCVFSTFVPGAGSVALRVGAIVMFALAALVAAGVLVA
jgi:predicted phage tail protein